MSLTFRLYLCSHITDTKAERDHLHSVVFPELRRRLARSGCQLEVIDLRHGLTSEEEAEGAAGLANAFRKIGECRPWFLALLGARVGPILTTLPDELLAAHPGLRDVLPASRMELELWKGVFREDRPAAALLYWRREPDADAETWSRLERVRERAEESGRGTVRSLPLLFFHSERYRDRYLTVFGEAVLDDLSFAMDAVFRAVLLESVQEEGAVSSRAPEPGPSMEMTARIIQRTLAGYDPVPTPSYGSGPPIPSVAEPPAAAEPAPDEEALTVDFATPSDWPVYVDENVQFTVYRPRVVAPEKWYPLLAFAHLSERPRDAAPGTPDPVEEVYRQAKQALGASAKDYQDVTQDSRAAVPREGELTLVPEIPGVLFNPPRRSFLWTEPVHKEEFRLKANADLDGQTVRGRLTVYLGGIILADVALTLRVDSAHRGTTEDAETEQARPYRRIFASYSHKDAQVVQQVDHLARAFGDRYLRDWTELRAGEAWDDRLMEMIRQADVFQLFWSHNSMVSAPCRREWEYALSLGRQYFVRPTYWEEPLPASRDGSLPPEELRRLHFQKIYTESLTHPQPQPACAAEQVTLLDQILDNTRSQTPEERSRNREHIDQFIRQVVKPNQVLSRDVERTVITWIAEIDKKLSAQLNEVMHHPDFQKLEGTWRGLHYLVQQTETGEFLQIRVLNVSKRELFMDLEKTVEFDQSQLFKKVYESEYGRFSGSPFGLLVGDFEFGRHPADIGLLKLISGVAASAHAPFVAAASPMMFGFERFTELPNPRDLARIFDSVEYAAWKSFRESEDSRYVALTLPRVLARLPYGRGIKIVEEFGFEEFVDGKHHDKYLWMSAAWAYAARVTDAFARYGWFAHTRGVEGGGLVEDLPVHTFPTDDGGVALKCPTEIAISDRREFELSNLGFLPLLHARDRDVTAFLGAQSCQKPKEYRGPKGTEATSNAQLSAKFNVILCMSRFGSYVKVLARMWIASNMSGEECERRLNEWISDYVLEAPELAGENLLAARPLLEARVEVRAIKGQPGQYEAVAWLRPHFQLATLTATMRLVVEVPPMAGLPPSVPSAVAVEPPPSKPVYVDENVQFTVYRPRVVAPEKWYPMLAFAHLSERPADAPPGSPDPVEEVYRQAKHVLGASAKDYQDVTQDSRVAIPREGELTLVPEIPGVLFNPPRRSFLWTEPVHKEEFRLKANADLDGKTVRGRLTVYLGSIILADVSLTVRVDSSHRPVGEDTETEKARPYRKIFASYSHRDVHVVQQVEHMARVFGDRYLRDWTELRAGEVWDDRLLEMIRQADVFQLFWSHNSMVSVPCRREWEYALSLGRQYFVRPTYWEEPLPASRDGSLPPEELRRLHFQKIFTEALTHPQPQPTEGSERLEQLLSDVMANPEKLAELRREVSRSIDVPAGGGPPPPAPAPPTPERPAAPQPTPAPRGKLSRVRRPRVRISYGVETAGAATHAELPFVVGVLADLSGHSSESPPFRDRQFLTIDRDNFDDVLNRLAPRLHLRVPDGGTQMAVELRFRRFEDFEPAGVAAQVPPLRELLAHRQANPNAQADIDRRLSEQLRAVMHHPDFQRLEGTWRGLHYLVHQSETSESLKIRVLNVSKRELFKDLEKAVEFDQSLLFKKVCEAEYGQLGGQPFGLLVGDFEFGRHPEDVALLKLISGVSATGFAPFVAAVSPAMLGLASWTELLNPRDLASVFDSVAYAAWKSFRESADSRFVALTLPRVLARVPYGRDGKPVEEFDFEERRGEEGNADLLWMSTAWAYAARVTDAYARDGWLARIRGVEGGGRVEGLPLWIAPTDQGDVALKCPTEIAISDRREFELSNLGFLPLLSDKDRVITAFLGAQSCQKPSEYRGPQGAAATASAQLSAKFNFILCMSQFARYLKVLARDKFDRSQSAEECERWLNEWINDYVLEAPELAGEKLMAEKPLREARVEVRSAHGKPGQYEVVAWLRPHFQNETLTATLRLVIEAAPLAGPSTVAAPPPKPIYADENVQFTVYRPRVVAPEKWYPMLAFAHLSERPADAPAGTPDPVAEVYRQAKHALGALAKDYQDVTQDSRAVVPREGELTLVPEVPGVLFNPPRGSFLWTEPVHKEEFRLKANADLDGKTVRGRLTVYLGGIILADVPLTLRVDAAHRPSTEDAEAEQARPYRRIFASYSHRDAHVVQQVEHLARAFGDRYLRDWTELRAGEVWDDRLMEMIRQADVFQLFWSHNSMVSAPCRREWEYALSLGRPYFVRPTYWEEPLPASHDGSLPPEELRRLHFQKIFTEALTHPQMQPAGASAPPPVPASDTESLSVYPTVDRDDLPRFHREVGAPTEPGWRSPARDSRPAVVPPPAARPADSVPVPLAPPPPPLAAAARTAGAPHHEEEDEAPTRAGGERHWQFRKAPMTGGGLTLILVLLVLAIVAVGLLWYFLR